MVYNSFYLNHTAKVIDNIIVELDELELFVHTHYEHKIGRNCSKLGSNCQMLINPAKVFCGYENPYIFPNIYFYSIEVISTLMRTHW